VRTLYVNQVVSLADVSFVAPTDFVTPHIITKVKFTTTGGIVVESNVTFPMLSFKNPAEEESPDTPRERVDSLRSLLEKIREKKNKNKKENKKYVEQEVAAAYIPTNKGGRPKKIDKEKLLEAKRLMQESKYTVVEICDMLHISKSTLYRHLKKTGRLNM
jgi:DNA-binding transcriptional ArsR family regulator